MCGAAFYAGLFNAPLVLHIFFVYVDYIFSFFLPSIDTRPFTSSRSKQVILIIVIPKYLFCVLKSKIITRLPDAVEFIYIPRIALTQTLGKFHA